MIRSVKRLVTKCSLDSSIVVTTSRLELKILKMIDISSLCDEWSDSERMRVMFAPMRNKELNPESFNSKIKFWTELIHKWCTVHNRCSFTLGQLEKDFQRDGSTPHCLADVLGEALKSGKIVDTKRFTSNLVPQESWGSWAKSIGWRAAGVSVDYNLLRSNLTILSILVCS